MREVEIGSVNAPNINNELLEKKLIEHEQANKVLQKAVVDRGLLLRKIYADVHKAVGVVIDKVTINLRKSLICRMKYLISTRIIAQLQGYSCYV